MYSPRPSPTGAGVKKAKKKSKKVKKKSKNLKKIRPKKPAFNGRAAAGQSAAGQSAAGQSAAGARRKKSPFITGHGL